MKKSEKEEEKPDGLEITSIGSLYKGPWDKKYWSSSRGKDRYPYPVGYKAVRTHNGSTHKMEIHEGLKGPLFVIASADGQSCSGQTPDIAWDRFQKQGYSRVKLLHGKRFSCKIDGVEFFGFRNPFVQRLLRELVTNVNGRAERSLLSSSFCNEVSGTEHDTQCSHPCTYPDLLAHLAKPQITRKRSRKRQIIDMKSISRASPKKLQHQDLTYSAETSNSRQGNQRNHNGRNCFTSSDVANCPGALPLLVNSETVALGENSSFLGQDVSLLESSRLSDHLKEKAFLPQEESRLVSSENCINTEVANNVSTEEKPLDRLQDTEMLGFSFSMATTDRNGEALLLKDAPGINDGDIFAPDTLDLLQDNTIESAPSSPTESSYNVKDGLISAHMVISEGSPTESHPEEEMGTSTSNISSEKSDFDSVGQEITKSMMTLLLPQALPLLKKPSKKRNKTIKPLEISPCMVKYQEEKNGSDHFVDATSPAGFLTENYHGEKEKKMHILSKDPDSVVEHINSIIPDSFEIDQCEQHVTNQLPLYSDTAEADRCTPDTFGLLGSTDAWKESLVCDVATCSSREIICSDVHTSSNRRPQKGDIFISDSSLGCTSPSKKIFPARFKDVCKNPNENSKCLEKDHKTAHDYTEVTNDTDLMGKVSCVEISEKEIDIKMRGAGTDNTSFTQITDVAPLARKYNGPLSESIICRNLGDGCLPETQTGTGTLLATDLQVSSSDNSPNKKVSVGAEARFEGQLHSLHTEKATFNPEAILYSTDSVMSHNQASACASEDKDTTDFLNPPSRLEKYHTYLDKELVSHQNPVEVKSSEPWLQKQGTNLCNNNTSDAKGVQTGSDLKPRMNKELNSELEGFVKLVGCYVHPLPVLSVLLSTKGHEIYICVLCGLLVDKDRTLFIYKLPIKEPRTGCPSFIGHASIMFPISKDSFGRQLALDRYGLQLTPDGQCLVLLNSIKAPYCSERKIHCLCSACTLDCLEENAVKIVRVQLGYVSVVAKLKTVDSVHCILVCEPNHLIAVEEGGKLHMWVMNSTWSAQVEEFIIPTYDCISPCVVEVKKIPKCAHLVIGHNGFGEFVLWDISKRILISRFSAPSSSVFQFLPISLFNWKREGPLSSNPSVEDHVNKIMAATKIWFSEHSENHACLPSEGQDMAIWLLVSTVPDFDAQHNYQSDCQMNPVGWWRLALLVKNMVILGSALDPRAAAIGASTGHGIIATCDGLVYMWELSTGAKLGTLHYFKGGGVSCIATDDSRSGVLAVAGDGGKLLIYLHS